MLLYDFNLCQMNTHVSDMPQIPPPNEQLHGSRLSHTVMLHSTPGLLRMCLLTSFRYGNFHPLTDVYLQPLSVLSCPWMFPLFSCWLSLMPLVPLPRLPLAFSQETCSSRLLPFEGNKAETNSYLGKVVQKRGRIRALLFLEAQPQSVSSRN